MYDARSRGGGSGAPGERTTVYHELTPDRRIQNWFGSLVDDMRDATGQMYRRNRYYDPQTGQFTQPDPIGLAGGLNAYGFAEGIRYRIPIRTGCARGAWVAMLL